MTFQLFIGFDTGCDKLNWHALNGQEVELGYGELANNTDSIRCWAEQLIHQHDLCPQAILICIEDTGLYSLKLAYQLQEQGFGVWLQDALQIKQSIGRTKSKNDQLDAYRITRYALRNQADYQAFIPNNEVLLAIKSLISQRKRLVKAKNLLQVPIGQERKFFPLQLPAEVYVQTDESVRQLKAAIKAIDTQIDAWIARDERYTRTVKILQSLPGIGPANARLMLIKTNNFERGYAPKQLASLFGIAPHERQSGKRLNRKPRTHPRVDREVKAGLYMGMIRQIPRDNKIARYYARKIREGKHHNSIINAMANIIVTTACACLRKQVMYDKDYQHKLA